MERRGSSTVIMSTTAEQLMLRGLNLVVRASFSPNDPAGQAKHFAESKRQLTYRRYAAANLMSSVLGKWRAMVHSP